jgi:hypothetical protein
MAGAPSPAPDLRPPDGHTTPKIRRGLTRLPKNEPANQKLAAKKSQTTAALREQYLSSGILADFDDNVIARLRRKRDLENRLVWGSTVALRMRGSGRTP